MVGEDLLALGVEAGVGGLGGVAASAARGVAVGGGVVSGGVAHFRLRLRDSDSKTEGVMMRASVQV